MIDKKVSHFHILEKIGEGGMGIVYRGKDTRLDREVALKFLSRELTGQGEAKTRFIHEAKIASRLDHPNICTVYEVDETPEGQLFIAMAYYSGTSLRSLISKGPIPSEKLYDITLQIIKGLGAARQSGIIHRDIKPENIFITNQNEVKILDFGLARLENQARVTRTGVSVGTAAYMAPEQIKGEAGDHRVDIWALGIIIYEMLTGSHPFKGTEPNALMYSIINDPPRTPDAVKDNQGIWNIILKLLQKEADSRCSEITEIESEILKNRSGEKVTKAPKGFSARAHFKEKKKWLISITLAASVALLIFLFNFLPAFSGASQIPKNIHLAVFPFEIEGENQALAEISRGLGLDLKDRLTRIEKFKDQFWVLSSHLISKGTKKEMESIRRQWGVNLILKGTLSQHSDGVFFRLKLINPASSAILRTLEYKTLLSDTSLLQVKILEDILENLNFEISQEIRETLTMGNTSIPGAYINYLKGLGSISGKNPDDLLDRRIVYFQKALEQAPHFALAYQYLAVTYRHKAVKTKNRSLMDTAMGYSQLSIEKEKGLASNYLAAGDIYALLRQWDNAIQQYSQALLYDRAYYNVYRQMASVYQQQNKLSEMEEVLKKLIECRPDFKDGYDYLGYFYGKLNRYPEAVKMYSKIIQLVPEDYGVYRNLGGIYSLMADINKGIEMFEKAISIKPADSYSLSNLGTLYYYSGSYTEAVKTFRKLLSLESPGVDTYRIQINILDCLQYIPEKKEEIENLAEQVITVLKEKLKEKEEAAPLADMALCQAYTANFSEALYNVDKAVAMSPQNTEVLWRAIVIYNFKKNKEKTLKWVKEYLDRFGTTLYLEKDPHLSGLRETPEYQEIMRQQI